MGVFRRDVHHPEPTGAVRDDTEAAGLRDELRRERAETAQALATAERRLVQALAEQLSALEAEKAQALAAAERRLVQALAEQRSEMEEEARGLLVQVARLRGGLERERAQVQAELAAIRRQRSELEPQLAAIVHPSARAARG